MDNQPLTNPSFENKFLTILAATVLFILLVSLVVGMKVYRRDASVPTETALNPFNEITLKAKAVYVYDIRTKTVLFAKNENTRLPLASLTKVMSALVAEDLSPMYGTITINGEALSTEGDSGFHKDEKWSLKSLLDFSLITSSNDGMRAIALSLGALSKSNVGSEVILNDFVGEMNKRARELGLKNMYFWNETGLDISASKTDLSDVKGGAYGTARDMSTLLEYILAHSPELLSATREPVARLESLDNYEHLAKNTNVIAAEIPGLLASKTGLTETAGGNLVIVFDPELGRPIIVSVLGSTEEGRFEDVRSLVYAVMEYIKK